MDKIEGLLTRGVANIIPGKEELRTQLQSDKKLNIYLGIDPTSTRIHLGHALPLRKLQIFAELGHHVIFLIGDFTSLIGDTSDKDTERPVLTKEEIQDNFKTYKKQAEKLLDFSKVEVRHNSEWLNKLAFEDIVKLCQHFAVGDFVGRELIRKRLQDNKRVGLHETLYPVMQGYDSYFLDTDIQLGGTDQTFNMQAGRTLQKDLRKKESFVMANGFLEGTDGRKMSKSWGNAIWLDDSPHDIYAKVMSIRDELIIPYYTLGTNVDMEKVEKIKHQLASDAHPLLLKKALALTIVTELHSESDALLAQEQFEKTVQNNEMPENIPTFSRPHNSSQQTITDILIDTGLALSRAEAKRLVEQGGVYINDTRIDNFNVMMDTLIGEKETIIKVGKRKFVKIV